MRADNVEQLGNEQDVLVCGSDWIGMAEEDVPNALRGAPGPLALPDAARPPAAGLRRTGCSSAARSSTPGAAADPAFRRDGRALIDTRRLFYYGNSQGGIAGGALTALAPDFTRSVLYVGAMNYSLLLQRSVDFDPFAAVLARALPRPARSAPLIISLLQVLWDRGEPNGYAWHMTRRPLPEHPAPHGAAARVLRRPPGRQRGHGGRGADDRLAACACRRWTRAAAPTSPAVRDPAAAAAATARRDAILVVWDIGPLAPARPGHAGRRRRPTCRRASAWTRTTW